MKKKDISIIIAMIIFVLTGCSPTDSQTQETGCSAKGSTPSGVPLKTFTPAENLQAANTILPFSPIYDSREKIEKELQTNGDCRLPCIWKLTPGITDVSGLENFETQFQNLNMDRKMVVDKYEAERGSTISISLWQDKSRVNIHWANQISDGKLDSIKYSLSAANDEGAGGNRQINSTYGDPYFLRIAKTYLLSAILTEYGEPSSVWIAPITDETNGFGQFFLTLAYFDQNFSIEYIMQNETVGDDYVGCPTGIAYITIEIVSPYKQLHAPVVSGYSWGINNLSKDYPRLIQDVTDLDTASFYDHFKGATNSVCIKTPVDQWVDKQSK
jgi:hypothetical protein